MEKVRHMKTMESLAGPMDWSLPHDEDCPGCIAISLAERVEAAERERDEALRRSDLDYKRFSEAKRGVISDGMARVAADARAARYEEALREIVKSDDEPSPGYAASPDYYVGLYEQAEIARAVLAASEGTPTPSKEGDESLGR